MQRLAWVPWHTTPSMLMNSSASPFAPLIFDRHNNGKRQQKWSVGADCTCLRRAARVGWQQIKQKSTEYNLLNDNFIPPFLCRISFTNSALVARIVFIMLRLSAYPITSLCTRSLRRSLVSSHISRSNTHAIEHSIGNAHTQFCSKQSYQTIP